MTVPKLWFPLVPKLRLGMRFLRLCFLWHGLGKQSFLYRVPKQSLGTSPKGLMQQLFPSSAEAMESPVNLFQTHD